MQAAYQHAIELGRAGGGLSTEDLADAHFGLGEALACCAEQVLDRFCRAMSTAPLIAGVPTVAIVIYRITPAGKIQFACEPAHSNTSNKLPRLAGDGGVRSAAGRAAQQ